MYNSKIYEIWLQGALGFANSKVLTVSRLFESAEDAYNADEHELRLCGCFTKKELELLCNKSLENAVNIYNTCIRTHIKMTSLWDDDYPELLREIVDPPCLLYYRGDLPGDNLCIAIVGTREATPSGIKLANNISRGLAKYGITVASGGALGIDTAAHKGCLAAAGKGICVLGCGINSNYLYINKALRDEVAKNGTLISEYPPDMGSAKYSFPLRNRIISGLCAGVVVVEAGERSGSLITARLALEQGRDVFAVPGDAMSSVSFGTNTLIKTGAKPVTTAQEIIDEYNNYSLNNNKTTKINLNNNKTLEKTEKECKIEEYVINNIESYDLSEDAVSIYKRLQKKAMHIDEICATAGMTLSRVYAALTELEIENLITTSVGRMYSVAE